MSIASAQAATHALEAAAHAWEDARQRQLAKQILHRVLLALQAHHIEGI